MNKELLLDQLRDVNAYLSYEKIGRELGVSLQTVSRWINNKNKPSDLALKQIEIFVNNHNNSE